MMKISNLSSQSIQQLINNKKDGIVLGQNDFSFFISTLLKKNQPWAIGSFVSTLDLKGLNVDECVAFINAIHATIKSDFANWDGIDNKSAKNLVLDYLNINEMGDSLPLILGPILQEFNLKFHYIYASVPYGFNGTLFDKLETIGVTGEIPYIKKSILSDPQNQLIYQKVNHLMPVFASLMQLLNDCACQNITLYLCVSLALKFWANNHVLIVNLKFGNCAYIKNINEAKKVSQLVIDIANKFNKKVIVLLSSSDNVLDRYIGSALEIKKVTDFFNNYKDWTIYTKLIKKIVSEILYRLNININKQATEDQVEQVLADKKALIAFQRLVVKQKGYDLIKFNNFRINKYFVPKYKTNITASQDGFIEFSDYNQLYHLCEQLRIYKTQSQKLDSQAGIQFNKLGGDQVKKDDLIATIYSSQKINKEIINTFTDNIKYYDKREQFTIKNYLQDVNDNLNLIKVNRELKNKE